MQATNRTCGQGEQSTGAPALPEARQLLRQTGGLCLHIAEFGDDGEIRALLRTLEQMPAILRRRGLPVTGDQ
jgi:hypothetical protein